MHKAFFRGINSISITNNTGEQPWERKFGIFPVAHNQAENFDPCRLLIRAVTSLQTTTTLTLSIRLTKLLLPTSYVTGVARSMA